MSTPDRAAYAQASEQKNPFHVHELTVAEFRDELSERFAHSDLFLQRPITGSRIAALERPGAGSHAGFTLRRSGDEWSVGGEPSPLYVLAVASREPLPELVRDSTLSDFGLELVRVAERRGADQVGRVEEVAAEQLRHANAARAALERVNEEKQGLVHTVAGLAAERDEIAGQLVRTASDLDDERRRGVDEAGELARVRASVSWQMIQRGRAKLHQHQTAAKLVSFALRRVGRVLRGPARGARRDQRALVDAAAAAGVLRAGGLDRDPGALRGRVDRALPALDPARDDRCPVRGDPRRRRRGRRHQVAAGRRRGRADRRQRGEPQLPAQRQPRRRAGARAPHRPAQQRHRAADGLAAPARGPRRLGAGYRRRGGQAALSRWLAAGGRRDHLARRLGVELRPRR